MRRDLSVMAGNEYDLVVIGGGITGLAAAWDATLRGLSVAVVERRDFVHGASANCFKMVHGGIRYLQHADLARVRESSRERTTLLRIAPHLARPLPILIPTYGHGIKGKQILAAGGKLYDLLTFDRNRGIRDPAGRIPPTHAVSRAEALEHFPHLEPQGLTGGVLFHDGQMHSPARLALAFLQAAVERGAQAANYLEATRLDIAGGRVRGVEVRDTQSDQRFVLRGKVVLNASGGWVNRFLGRQPELALAVPPNFSRDACFVVRRRLVDRVAIAISGGTRDPDALVSRDARHLFLVPWRDCTLVGVWHAVHTRDPDDTAVSGADLRSFLDELRGSCPALAVEPGDVVHAQGGLTLFGENREGARDLSYGKRSLLVDHAATHGVEGLITLVSVRFTVARLEAERAMRAVFGKLDRPLPACATHTTPLWGGDFERFDALQQGARASAAASISNASLEALLRNHGSRHGEVLAALARDPGRRGALGASHTLGAEVLHAVRDEMAQTLSDVVFRRTDLGGAGSPGREALESAADLMAAELGWSAERRAKELDETQGVFPSQLGVGAHHEEPETCRS